MTSSPKPYNFLPNIPNAISFLRVLLSLSLPFMLLHPNPKYHFWALGVFVFAAITDYLDGQLARTFSWHSGLGKIVDPTADKFLILIPLGVFSYVGIYSVWWIVPIFIREIVVTFCRIGLSLQGAMIGAEKVGKLKFVFQVATVLGAFFDYLSVHSTLLQSYQGFFHGFTQWTLIGAFALTIISGISFFQSNRAVLSTPAFAKFCSAFGVGLIPFAPGTWGTGIGLILAFLCSFNFIFYLVVGFLLILFGFWAVNKLQLSHHQDPSYVVSDEVIGVYFSMMFIPMTPWMIVAAFFLFRFFDILKPFPLRRLEHLPGFWGILLDDMGAGLYTWMVLFWILS